MGVRQDVTQPHSTCFSFYIIILPVNADYSVCTIQVNQQALIIHSRFRKSLDLIWFMFKEYHFILIMGYMTCLTQSALCCLIFPKLPLDQSSMQFKQKVISMSFSMMKKNPLVIATSTCLPLQL